MDDIFDEWAKFNRYYPLGVLGFLGTCIASIGYEMVSRTEPSYSDLPAMYENLRITIESIAIVSVTSFGLWVDRKEILEDEKRLNEISKYSTKISDEDLVKPLNT